MAFRGRREREGTAGHPCAHPCCSRLHDCHCCVHFIRSTVSCVGHLWWRLFRCCLLFFIVVYQEVSRYSCPGRVVSVLEGGYGCVRYDKFVDPTLPAGKNIRLKPRLDVRSIRVPSRVLPLVCVIASPVSFTHLPCLFSHLECTFLARALSPSASERS